MVFTFSGEYGCGSKETAKILAEITGYKLCDDDVVAQATKDYGIDIEADTFKYYDESIGSASVAELQRQSNAQRGVKWALVSLEGDVLPLDMRIDKSVRAVQTKLADEGNCIFLGKCANYYLRGRDDVISLFFADTDEAKRERIMGIFNCDEKTAEKMIKKTDKRRSDYYSYFTGEKWADPENYDFWINTAALGVEKTAKLLAALIKIKEG